jgi:hypothetical protein
MGTSSQLPIDPDFPNSRADNYEKSSEATIIYNCIAWAIGESHRWWQPDRFRFWPAGALYNTSKEALIDAYEKIGFEKCENGNVEDGFLKVALYTKDNINYEHAARLEQNGIWKSKLGEDIDIDHSLEALENGLYGNVYQFMKKKII